VIQLDKEQISRDLNANDPLDDRVEDATDVGGTVAGGNTAAPPAAPGIEEPFLIGNAGRFFRASDFFRIVFLGPRIDSSTGDLLTVADTWRDPAVQAGGGPGTPQYRIRNFMIDADAAAALAATNPADFIDTAVDAHPYLKQTFPSFILSHLSTFAPGSDEVDNDGDGRIDDADERLVPGRINLNTVPIVLDGGPGGFANYGGDGFLDDPLERVLPLASDEDRGDFANAVLDLRQRENLAPASPRASERNRPDHGLGIASVAEFLDHQPIDFANVGLAEEYTGDFNEYESDLDPAAGDITFAADGVTNNLEERMAIIGALKQTFDVRSDIYTVYIRLRGYPTGQFDEDPQREFFIVATIDRSVVGPNRPVPKILSYVKYEPQGGP
jgi:hypothetical protein